MLRALKLAHIVGLVIFLGSILTFIVISALIEDEAWRTSPSAGGSSAPAPAC